jgi:RNA polymerase sigma-70 factor (ECF subfamily)
VPKDPRERFETLAMPQIDAVYRAALSLCGRADQADDLVQQTYLRAWEKFRSFEQGTNCKAWMMRILRNGWIDQLRRQGRVNFLPLDEEMAPAAKMDGGEDAATRDEAAILDGFSDQQVLDALGQLPPDQRMALLLVDVERMDHRDVAVVLDVPEGTVKSRTSRARAALRAKLQAHAKDLGFVKR